MMKSQIVHSGNAAQAASKPTVETSASVWMTIQDAATYLGVGVDKIYEACAGGGLRHARFGTGLIKGSIYLTDQAPNRGSISKP